MSNDSKENRLLLNFLYDFLKRECKLGEVTSTKIASQFTELNKFVQFDFKRFRTYRSVDGNKLIRGFRNEYVIKIQKKIKYVNPQISLIENYLQLIGRDFIRTQVLNLRDLTLEKLNPNPFLINALNLKNVDEMIEFLVFQRAARSIVTSFGFCLERLLIASGSEKLTSGFDIFKIVDKITHYIQVKSGTSDMDKDQIKFWKNKIVEVEKKDSRGYIGMPYGKRDKNAITINLMKSYLPNWEARTLIGKELWEFISEEKDFHEKVLDCLKISATQILNNSTILNIILKTIERIKTEFKNKYGDNIDNYINDLF